MRVRLASARNRFTSSSSKGFAAQPRTLRVKIWRQSAPSSSARPKAVETPPATPSWAPRIIEAAFYTIGRPGAATPRHGGPARPLRGSGITASAGGLPPPLVGGRAHELLGALQRV